MQIKSSRIRSIGIWSVSSNWTTLMYYLNTIHSEVLTQYELVQLSNVHYSTVRAVLLWNK